MIRRQPKDLFFHNTYFLLNHNKMDTTEQTEGTQSKQIQTQVNKKNSTYIISRG